MKTTPYSFTPEMNDGHTVFVFGSNLTGRHGAGAAAQAYLYWGAEYHQGEGRQGQSYAIPTKDADLQPLSLVDINIAVQKFLAYAGSHLEELFLITRIGCGLTGYKNEQIAPMFKTATSNCVFSETWYLYLI